MAQYIDSHAHLSSEMVLPNIKAIIERSREAGIEKIINICTDLQSLQKGIELAAIYPEIINAGATTPHDVEKEGEPYFPLFAKAAQEGKIAAIGETGLDYYHDHSPRPLQQSFLRRYFELSLETKLPIIFHCRDAFLDLFKLADESYRVGAKWGSAILHCFTGTEVEAEQVFSRGWYLSFSGIVTYKKSERLREIAKWAPLDRILIETDTPYLAPQKRRGLPNEPSFLPEIAMCIAEAKGISVEEIGAATRENALKFLKLS